MLLIGAQWPSISLAKENSQSDCQKQVAACDEALTSCDAAIDAAQDVIDARNKEIQLCRLALTQSVEMSQGLNSELVETRSKLESPFRNPFIMTTVGVVLGILVTGFALK